jgi:hypothetical protein
MFVFFLAVAMADRCMPFTCRKVVRPDEVCGEIHEDYYEVFKCPDYHRCVSEFDYISLEAKRVCKPDFNDEPEQPKKLPGEPCEDSDECVKNAMCDKTCF